MGMWAKCLFCKNQGKVCQMKLALNDNNYCEQYEKKEDEMDDEEHFTIIENTRDARRDFGYCYCGFELKVRKADLAALLEGKILAATINNEEYSVFIEMED